jgi:hypothetical protein
VTRLPRIELSRGWTLDRYFGWSDLARGPGLRLLAKRRGPLRQLLLLTDGAPQEDVDAVAAHHGVLSPLAWTTWNDFSATEADPPRPIAGRTLPRVAGVQWFGVGTYVIDLEKSEDELFTAIQRARSKELRRAEKKGVRVTVTRRPPRGEIAAFLAMYDAMAKERALEALDPALMHRMFDDGAAVLTRAFDASGRDLVVNVTYTVGAYGYYLHGTRAGDVMDGTGHLAQWETIRFLKAEGRKVYDLGLVASQDEADGIFRFKRSLGGAFVSSGREVSHVPLAMKAARRLREAIRER